MKKWCIATTDLKSNVENNIPSIYWQFKIIEGIYFETEENAKLARTLLCQANPNIYATWIILES